MFQNDISTLNVFVFSNYNIVLKNDASAACTYKYQNSTMLIIIIIIVDRKQDKNTKFLAKQN